MVSKSLRVGALIFLLLTLGGCVDGESVETAPSDPVSSEIVVYTVNYPLRYFAERIGGDLVRVEFPAPADLDPAFWSPDVETVSEYQSADLILLNGAGYAKWVDRVSLRPSALIDTSSGFADRLIVVEDAAVHTHGPEGDHSHGTLAFTVWLDLELAARQAAAVRDALARLRPGNQDTFEQNYQELESDLHNLDRQLHDLVGESDLPLLASHPVYQYLAARYGLNLESVHFEPDALPDAKAWRGLEEILAEHPARWMIWEREPLEETVAKLRELGVESVVFDPCGNTPDDGDFLSLMRDNLAAIGPAFR